MEDVNHEFFFNKLDDILKFIFDKDPATYDEVQQQFNLDEETIRYVFYKLVFDGYIKDLSSEEDEIEDFQLTLKGKALCAN